MDAKACDGVRWLQYRWSVRYARCATHLICARREVLRLLRRCGKSQLADVLLRRRGAAVL